MKKFLLIMLSIVIFSSNLTAQWTQTNGPKGGSVGPIIKISDSEYAFFNSKYVYLSKDDCKTWMKVFPLPPFADSTQEITTIHYYDKKLYIGSTLGLFISDESLENFEKQNNSFFQEKIFTIESNDKDIFIATYVRSESAVFVYKSSIIDHTWTNITTDSTGYANGFISDIAIMDADNIYISTAGLNFDDIWTGPAMQVTSNGGITWKTIKTGLTNTAISQIGLHNNTLLITSSEGGMFKSNDHGENWQVCEDSVLPDGFFVSDIKSFGNYFYIALDKFGVFRSSDNGETWEAFNDGIEGIIVNYLCIDDEKIYLATNSGLYKFTETENKWLEYNDGLKGTYVLDMVVDNNCIYTTSQNYGLSKTTDGGDTWSKVPISQFQKQVQKLAVHGNTIYAEGSDSLFVSINNGSSWKNIKGNLNTEIGTMLYKTDTYLYACFKDGTYRTSNDGATWDTLKYDLKKITNITDMIYNDGELFVVNYDLGIIKSTDDGSTWSPINNGITNLHLYSIDLLGNRLGVSTYSGDVFLSDNKGEYWNLIKSSNSDYNIVSILLTENKIFLGTTYKGSPYVGDGIKLSLDNGLSWTDASNGLGEAKTIKKLVKLNDYIYAGTANHSVYKAKISDFNNVGVNDEKQTSNLILASSPYPLPSNQIVNTLINWSSEIDIENADMNVYNTLGEKVCGKEKINFHQQSPNSGIVTWNAEDNPSGVYFLHISVANEIKVIRFVID